MHDITITPKQKQPLFTFMWTQLLKPVQQPDLGHIFGLVCRVTQQNCSLQIHAVVVTIKKLWFILWYSELFSLQFKYFLCAFLIIVNLISSILVFLRFLIVLLVLSLCYYHNITFICNIFWDKNNFSKFWQFVDAGNIFCSL